MYILNNGWVGSINPSLPLFSWVKSIIYYSAQDRQYGYCLDEKNSNTKTSTLLCPTGILPDWMGPLWWLLMFFKYIRKYYVDFSYHMWFGTKPSWFHGESRHVENIHWHQCRFKLVYHLIFTECKASSHVVAQRRNHHAAPPHPRNQRFCPENGGGEHKLHPFPTVAIATKQIRKGLELPALWF